MQEKPLSAQTLESCSVGGSLEEKYVKRNVGNGDLAYEGPEGSLGVT